MASGEQESLGSGFGKHTTASEIMVGVNLEGKTAVVTGGYSGIGLETVKALHGAGAEVIVPVRTKASAEKSFSEAGLSIETGEMDLADLQSVERFASDVLTRHSQIDLLVNNAGIMACPEARVGKNWESQFGINHIGHFVLTKALERGLKKKGARVVSLSSIGHRLSGIRWDDIHFHNTPYKKWLAYGQAKTANALFARGLNSQWGAEGVQAFSAHPGVIQTGLSRHLSHEELVALGWADEKGGVSQSSNDMSKTPEQGCATTLWCATSCLLNDRGGEYCEDCDISKLANDESPEDSHVRSWACDDEEAERLWFETEKMLSA